MKVLAANLSRFNSIKSVYAVPFEDISHSSFLLLNTIKVVNSREVREVVEGSTCISDKKLSEIC